MPTRFAAASLLLLLLLLTALAYLPGLHGSFLFDDYGNLPAIGAGGPVDNWPSFWRYVTSGTADPTGRPLTLLTFLIDARNWPADPYPFKRTNLILHLLNGALLYMLLVRLGKALNTDLARRQVAALLGTALWLLHPLLVSTTLYIVQREAMLPATCVLIGLLLWSYGRAQLVAGKISSGLTWSIIGLGAFTVLGTLAKGNGVLLPIYALLIEIIIFAPSQRMRERNARSIHRIIMLAVTVIPAIFIILYLCRVATLGLIFGGHVDGRPWSTLQRLLTEPRVLTDYLFLLFFPQPFSTGLFNDQYVVSTSLLHPLSTLLAIVFTSLSILGAWCVRRRFPALALAVLFYFAAQMIESSALPLELYYEHRNYVPALLLFWPLGLWLADTRDLRILKLSLSIVLPLSLALMTHTRAVVWGDEQIQALFWARINPDSPRAQANAAQIEIQKGHPVDAAHRLQNLLEEKPDQVQLVFNLIGAHCVVGNVPKGDIASARVAMRNTSIAGTLFLNWFDRILPATISGTCPGLTTDNLSSFIDAGLQNPNLESNGTRQDLLYLRGRIALAQRRPDDALADFEKALVLGIRPGVALEAAAALGTEGHPAKGLQLLDFYEHIEQYAARPSMGMPMIHALVLARQGYWQRELAHLRHQLSLAISPEKVGTAPSGIKQSKPR